MKWNAGEVSRLTTRPLSGIQVGILEAFVDLKFLQQPATIKRFNRGRGESAYPKRKLLQW